MGYLGNSPQNQAFTPRVDYFSGNASATAFTLSFPIASVAQVQAVIENVPQNPSDAYTVSGNTITFTSAPPSGTNNIYVYYTSPITSVITPGYGTVGTAQLQSGILTPAAVSDQANTSTGYFDLPAGTTAERPVSPVVGMVRYNTTESEYEAYTASGWQIISTTDYPYSVEYLIVAGGGGGGGSGVSSYGSGGGGAGGYRSSVTGESSGGGNSAESPLSVTPGTAYTVTVGAGGTGPTGTTIGANGSDSVFSTITSVGGGGGATTTSGQAGANGGSGGGGGFYLTGGNGTSGQGYNGGTGNNGGTAAMAGGGGSGAVGGNGANDTKAGNGGNGVSSSINGSATTRGGGGGGGASYGGSATGGDAGSGGGGAGGDPNTDGTAATANTGGGGGGSGSQSGVAHKGGNGGSGLVIIRYLGAQRGTGGTVTSSGGYTIHTFTTSGTYTA